MERTKPKKKLYVVVKYIMAESIQDAFKHEKKISPDDIYVDPDWKKNNL